MQLLRRLGRFGVFVGQVLWRMVTLQWSPRHVAPHLWNVVTRCVLPVSAVVGPFGMVMAIQGLVVFNLFGAHRMLASLVSVAVLRELSPILASVLVAAQGGSAIAAALGSMRIKEELDATQVMAVDPIALHVVPRVVAMSIATPLLHLVGCTAGLVGGYVVAVVVKGEQSGVFLDELWAFTQPLDLWAGLLKTSVYGVGIGLIATYKGYSASGGAAGVGRAVNDTVVYASTAIVAGNYLMSTLLFGVAS